MSCFCANTVLYQLTQLCFRLYAPICPRNTVGSHEFALITVFKITNPIGQYFWMIVESGSALGILIIVITMITITFWSLGDARDSLVVLHESGITLLHNWARSQVQNLLYTLSLVHWVPSIHFILGAPRNLTSPRPRIHFMQKIFKLRVVSSNTVSSSHVSQYRHALWRHAPLVAQYRLIFCAHNVVCQYF